MVKLDVYLPVLRADINNSVIVDYNLTDSMVSAILKVHGAQMLLLQLQQSFLLCC